MNRVRRGGARLALGCLVAVVGMSSAAIDTAAAPTTAAAPSAAAATDEQLRIYINSVYQLLLGRDADQVGMDYWLSLLHRGFGREAVAKAITNGDEFRGQFLASDYAYFLLRPIDPDGLLYFLGLLRLGFRIEDIDVILMASDEYYDFADRIPTEFIRIVYNDLLGREPEPNGMAYWQSVLGSNPDPGRRALVAAAIIYSTEALTPVVDGYFQAVLGRPSDPAGIAYWIARIQAGHRDEDIIALLIGSDEYFDLVT